VHNRVGLFVFLLVSAVHGTATVALGLAKAAALCLVVALVAGEVRTRT
jgi:hypothetical protein